MSGHLVAYKAYLARDGKPGRLPASSADGLLTAVALTPDEISPAEWFTKLWGEEAPGFADDTERMAIIDGLFARLAEIHNDLTYEGPIRPVLDAQGHAGEWARGFTLGMEIRPWHWDKLINDETQMQILAPIVVHLDDPAGLPLSTTSGRPIQELRQEAITILPAALTSISLFFAMQNQQARKANAKTGRNDPCPCGSGKKYKKCCLVS